MRQRMTEEAHVPASSLQSIDDPVLPAQHVMAEGRVIFQNPDRLEASLHGILENTEMAEKAAIDALGDETVGIVRPGRVGYLHLRAVCIAAEMSQLLFQELKP